jgi:hypothetical protein
MNVAVVSGSCSSPYPVFAMPDRWDNVFGPGPPSTSTLVGDDEALLADCERLLSAAA